MFVLYLSYIVSVRLIFLMIIAKQTFFVEEEEKIRLPDKKGDRTCVTEHNKVNY